MSDSAQESEMPDDGVTTFPRLVDTGVSLRAPDLAFPYYIAPHLVAQCVLGEGGTAVVYQALHTRLKLRVAVKLLRVSGVGTNEARERMQREAELCARIDNARIPHIYDVDTLPDGTPYVVMEEVRGRPLDELLRNGPLDVELSCLITCEVLEALEELHGAGIVHRDIKPSNLILEEKPNESMRVRVLDLGIAKPVTLDPARDDELRLTQAGALLGTPHYMASEQLLGGEIDARTDVYAVGVMLYESLAGRPPFEGNTVSQVIASSLRHDPRSLGDLRRDVPTRLQQIVKRAMQAEVGQRYASAREMLADLRAFQSGLQERSTVARKPALRQARVACAMALLVLAAAFALWPVEVEEPPIRSASVRADAVRTPAAGLSMSLPAVPVLKEEAEHLRLDPPAALMVTRGARQPSSLRLEAPYEPLSAARSLQTSVDD